MRRFARIFLSVLPFVYMVFIWILSSLPADAVIRFSFYDRIIKESLHLIEFAILYGLFAVALAANGRLTKKGNLIAAAISALYGAIDEIHQSFVPYRSADIFDFVKDITGILILYVLTVRGYFTPEKRGIGRLYGFLEKYAAPR
ncbi:MAG: hypothetical protein CW346_06695 [Bacillaceae bacterium]|jgi:VanZ family protein|nr:hypothetical protein [Bacillaceae bacterium]MBY6271884.1 hypothetical protein [Bacillaceae bacterium]